MANMLALPGLTASRSDNRLRITAEGKPRAAVDVAYITMIAASKGGKVPTYDGTRSRVAAAQKEKLKTKLDASAASSIGSVGVANEAPPYPEDDIIWTTPGTRRRALPLNGKVAMGLGKNVPPVKPFTRSDMDPYQLEASRQELEVKRRVCRLRRELTRSRSVAASMQVFAHKTTAGAEVRNMTKYLQGAHLSGSVKQVTPATEEQVKMVATALIQHLNDTRVEPSERHWYRLFRAYDSNGDGHIEYRELVDMVRNHIKMPPKKLPERDLQAVWHYIDVDGNGWIDAGEFGRFFRQGEQAFNKKKEGGGSALHEPRVVETPQGRKRELTLAEINVAATRRSTERLEQEEMRLQRELKRSSASLPSLPGHGSPAGQLPPLR